MHASAVSAHADKKAPLSSISCSTEALKIASDGCGLARLAHHGRQTLPAPRLNACLVLSLRARIPQAPKRQIERLCDQYFADAVAGRVLKRSGVAKKPSTLAGDKSKLERHIKPLVGRLAVGAFTPQDAERLLHDIAEGKGTSSGGKGAATRALGLLGAIFQYGVRRGLRSDNPIHGTARFACGRRERRLSDADYGLLGEGLKKAEKQGFWPSAIAAARFIAVSGWRKGEALGLRWDELDLARRTATLGDTKSGRSIRPLSQAACDMLHRQPRGPNPLVFAGAHGGNGSDTFKRQFRRIAKLGALPAGSSAHTLRHACVGVAADLDFSDLTIGALVGHRGRSVTSHHYVHSADTVLLAAADRVAAHIAQLMNARIVHKRIRRVCKFAEAPNCSMLASG